MLQAFGFPKCFYFTRNVWINRFEAITLKIALQEKSKSTPFYSFEYCFYYHYFS